ncbi:MAG: sigma-70 family RNA polymerase sigma factor [Oscillospiraceae bacterium]|nr:sigma-70 family RNA polymerase sigma factor [Oscillospiraceae bacterium]
MKYSDLDDESLVMLTLAGEQTAYEVLVIRYQKSVISAAVAVTHNQFMAEDAAQDAFVAAWMKLNLLREPEKFRFWVCRIAKNCAKNMLVRYRSYVCLDELENCLFDETDYGSPDQWYASKEEKEQLHESIGRLPEKVREIIHLHYFDGLSIVEIAAKMSISTGTVKSQLYDGRKKIRKEMCAMNEDINDTMTERVMKKVEELKNWQFQNSKNGFETVYNDVLTDVEKLPESKDKYHALADVLMLGWWWLTGDKNDALFSRIKEAAELGKNDEVMKFISAREDSKVWGNSKIEFIRDKQIPKLENAGFRLALASEWYWLGDAYFKENKPDEGFAAYEKALSIFKPSDADYAKPLAKLTAEKKCAESYKEIAKDNYIMRAIGEELRIGGGKIRHWSFDWDSTGSLWATDMDADMIFRNASFCDGQFICELSVGETHIGSDGSLLTYASSDEIVETPAGLFDGCQLWVTKHDNEAYKTYYKDGTGIVKQERKCDGITEIRLLKSCNIRGKGLLPCANGNTWEYEALYDPSVKEHTCRYTICFADGKKAILSGNWDIHRLRYDENCWIDMIEQIRNDYWDEDKVCDVSFPMERAKVLAKTPLQKAHTNAACSVAQRILATDIKFNPNYTETGHWNFFKRCVAKNQEGIIRYYDNFRWSFELKNTDGGADQPLLYNDIYGILQDAANHIWSNEWKPGVSTTEKYLRWDSMPIRTETRCEACGTVTTKAGSFENCMKLSLDITGLDEGLAYRGGKKEYYFARGVGIVRTVNYYCSDTLAAVYELTAFEGTGDGYMPFCDGMMRRYDALDLTDGYIGSTVYTYVSDDDGYIVVFEDRCGVRKKPEKITQYASIYGEVIEDQLWEADKHDESRLRHAVNNFNILMHFLGRPSRYWAAPDKAVAWNKYRMKILESMGDGKVPSAWLGLYSSTCFRTACALFGMGKNDEGYEYLDRSLELMPEWSEIPDGELLDVGDPLIYGGVRIVKGKELLELPDGKREPLSDYASVLDCGKSLAYYGMTASHGWEWFNGVRNEDRYKTAVERAKALME